MIGLWEIMTFEVSLEGENSMSSSDCCLRNSTFVQSVSGQMQYW